MNRLNVEVLLGRRIGLNSNYYRPTEKELFDDYLRAVPFLTINETKDVTELKQQREVLEKKQEEKDRLIEYMQKRLDEVEKNQEQVVQTTKSLQSLSTWLEDYKQIDYHKGEGLPHNLESMIWYFLQPDPEEGNYKVSEEEFARRNRGFPELAEAMEKIKARRLAEQNKKA